MADDINYKREEKWGHLLVQYPSPSLRVLSIGVVNAKRVSGRESITYDLIPGILLKKFNIVYRYSPSKLRRTYHGISLRDMLFLNMRRSNPNAATLFVLQSTKNSIERSTISNFTTMSSLYTERTPAQTTLWMCQVRVWDEAQRPCLRNLGKEDHSFPWIPRRDIGYHWF